MPTIAIAARMTSTIAVRIFSDVAHGAPNRWQEFMRRLETRRAGKSREILHAFSEGDERRLNPRFRELGAERVACNIQARGGVS
jgi:hypothetical protein